MQLRRINLSLNPYDYSSARFREREGTLALAGLIPRNHTLDNYGCPRVPNIGNFHRQEAMQSAINRLVKSIYSLNGATEILFKSKRDMGNVKEKVNHEIASFGDLGADEEARHKKVVRKREEEKVYQDKASENKNEAKEEVEIGVGLKNLTPEQIAIYSTSFKYMTEKRRAFAQAVKIAPHINAFGFAGLLMSGPQIYIPWALTSDGLGLKSPRKEDRLSALSLLEIELEATMREFKIATSNPENGNPFILFNFEDGVTGISSIIQALSQESFGINDSDNEIKARAINLEESAKEAEQLLFTHRGVKSTPNSSIFLSN